MSQANPPLQALRDYLALLARLQGKFSPARILLEHGQLFVPASRPAAIPLGEPHQCYTNAGRLATSVPRLRYAEGYLLNSHAGYFPLEHAWVITQGGYALDPTLDAPLDSIYFGLIFTRHQLIPWLETSRVYGVLTSHHPGLPGFLESCFSSFPR